MSLRARTALVWFDVVGAAALASYYAAKAGFVAPGMLLEDIAHLHLLILKAVTSMSMPHFSNGAVAVLLPIEAFALAFALAGRASVRGVDCAPPPIPSVPAAQLEFERALLGGIEPEVPRYGVEYDPTFIVGGGD